ncbi:GntR family transcriptional regulator [Sporanaerobacter acetigenes]|uniref:GntR family transcriptional regulator n=1 Tax=Sporanaerobacter acetigenes TaxID=165813 RepID=UPI0018EE62A9|nr:GntR family transcriptional regulator [Sporanaerobacter acetigenes]
MDAELKPVKIDDLRPIREIVFMELKKAIFDGRIKEGEHLVENMIAEKMNVSRTPVREALRQLEAEGLVINIPRRGAIVKGITMKDAEEIYDLREVLEGLMVRLACQNRTEEDISRLNQILVLMEKAVQEKKYNKYLELHKDYNDIILSSSKNKKLQLMMENIYEYLTSLRSVSLYSQDRRVLAIEEHRQIVNAIDKRNEVEAEKLARSHVKKAKKSFFDNLIEAND